MNAELNFENLLGEAISKWPEKVNVEVIENLEGDFVQYSINGLGALWEEIESNCIGIDGEVLWRELHCAIYSTINSAAKFVKVIEVRSLRMETVRTHFEEGLRASATCEYDLRWGPEDYALVDSYFARNRPEQRGPLRS